MKDKRQQQLALDGKSVVEQTSKSQDDNSSWAHEPKPPQVVLQGGNRGKSIVACLPKIQAPPEKDRRYESSLPRQAYTIKETASMLGISQRSVRRLLERRLLHSSLALRKKLIPATEITRFLQVTTSKEAVCQ